MRKPDRLGPDDSEEPVVPALEDLREFCEDLVAEARRYTREKPLRSLAGAFLVGALIGLAFRSGR